MNKEIYYIQITIQWTHRSYFVRLREELRYKKHNEKISLVVFSIMQIAADRNRLSHFIHQFIKV